MLEAGEFAAAWAVLAGVVAAVAGACALVMRRRLPVPAGSARLIAAATVFTALLVGVHVLPAVLGVLSRWSVLVTALLVLAAAATLPAADGAREPQRPAGPSGTASWALAALALVALGGWVLAFGKTFAAVPGDHVDYLSFHMPDVARWIQEGSLWGNHQFAALYSSGNYPQTGDVLLLASVLPFEQDWLARWAFFPWLGLAGAGVYALARELGVPRATGALAGALIASVPIFLRSTADAVIPDALCIFGFAAGVLFLLRHLRTRARPDLVLAAVALGLAFGSKWYGVSAGAVLLAVFFGGRALAERRASPLGEGFVVGAGVLLVGGLWMLRNVIETPSPIFPASLPPLFETSGDPIGEMFGFTIADYLGDGSVLRDVVLPDWWAALKLHGLLLIAGGVAGAWLAVRARAERRLALGLLVLAAAGLAVAYLFTPNTAFGPEGAPVLVRPNTRYVLPAAVIAAALLAVAIGRLGGRLRPVAEAALMLAVVVGAEAAWPISRSSWLAGAIALAVLGAAAWRMRTAAASLWPRAAAVAAAGVVLLGGLAAYALQRRQADGRYANLPPAARWVATKAPPGTRVALAGTLGTGFVAPIYPAFGPRLENEVEYAGHFEDGLLRDEPDAAAFARRLRDGRFDVLLAYSEQGPGEFGRWAEAAGWRLLIDGPQVALYGAPGYAPAT